MAGSLFNHASKEQGGCFKENHHPYQNTDTFYHRGLPQSLTSLTVQHGQVTIHTDTGHEGDASISVAVEDHGRQSAKEISKRPVKATDVVSDPAGQSQCEKRVRDGQVDQIYHGGVNFMFPLTDDAENQAVASNADDKNQGVKNGKKDPSRFLVDEHIASLVWGAVVQCHCGKCENVPETVGEQELWLRRKHITND